MSAGTIVRPTPEVQGWGFIAYYVPWTSDASGGLNGHPFGLGFGRLHQVEIIPATGDSQPSDNYDVTLVNYHGTDYLVGAGLNVSNAVGKLLVAEAPIVLLPGRQYDIVITNAGNAKSGTVVIVVGP